MQISHLVFASHLTCLAPSPAPSYSTLRFDMSLENLVKMSENTARNKEFWRCLSPIDQPQP